MKKAAISGIMLSLLFVGILTLAFRIQPVEAWIGGTIYIRENGSVDPETAPIDTDDNILYTLTDDIWLDPDIGAAIVVERDNIIIDGEGHTLQTLGVFHPPGMNLTGRDNVTIRNMDIKNFSSGIFLDVSSNITISENNITNIDTYGIALMGSSHNSITGNNISSFNCSIWLYEGSDYNSITGNNMTNNIQGVILVESNNNNFSGNLIANTFNGITLESSSSGNKFFHNTFLCSFKNVDIRTSGYTNFWDDGYPSGGNYWNNYTGVDLKNGPNQDHDGSDGIGDIPHVIDGNNQDNYPLTNPWAPVETFIEVLGVDYPVFIDSNTIIDQIGQTDSFLRFRSSGPTGETGYVLLLIPAIFPESEIRVFIDGIQVFPIIHTDGIYYHIYFEFQLSTHNIEVQFGPTVGGISIPVNKLSLLAPYIGLTVLLAVAVLTVVYVNKRKRNTEINS